MTHTEAIHIVSAFILVSVELPDWERYPEISSSDWLRMLNVCRQKLNELALSYTAEDFRKAYAMLEGLAAQSKEDME